MRGSRRCTKCGRRTTGGPCDRCFLEVIEDCCTSEDNYDVIAQRHGIGEVTLWRWRKRAGVVGDLPRSDGMKRGWSNSDVAQKRMSWRHQTKPEEMLGALLTAVISEEWRYTGLGTHPVGTKQPDFWDGNRGIIELFGSPYHRAGSEEERIDYTNSSTSSTSVSKGVSSRRAAVTAQFSLISYLTTLI